MAKLHNPLECCYKSQLSIDELKSLVELFIRYHEELRKIEYNLNSLAIYLVNTLKLRYKRVRFYVCDPRSKVYYGFLSTGMNEKFKEEFDSYPEHPFEKKKYKIYFDEVPTVISDKVTGTEETYLLCNQKIRSHFETGKDLPPYVADLEFGKLINHSLTIHIMAAQTTPLGAVSIDFGNMEEDKFSYEECQFLDAFVGTFFGRIIAPLLVKDFKEEVLEIETLTSSVVQDFLGDQSEGAFDYTKYKLSKKYKIIYNGASENHLLSDVFELIEKMKDTDLSIFLNAPTGTGKKLVAEALHYEGSRKNKPCIPIKCGELTDSLIQGELFGYAPRSGVSEAPKEGMEGLIEKANDGTLIVDEIGKASSEVRKKLLDVIEYKQVRRIGANEPKAVNVRLIFCANEAIENFSAEFLNRLGPRVDLPELEKRPEDIPVLITHFIDKIYQTNQTIITKLPIYINPGTLSKLLDYKWPGNVRELKTTVESALVYMKPEEQIIYDHHFVGQLPAIEKMSIAKNFGTVPIQIYPWPGKIEIIEHIDDVEKIYNEIAESNINDIFVILSKKLSFKIAKDFFEGLDKKNGLKEKVLNSLDKHGNKINLWKNLIRKDCCEGCNDWSQTFSKKEECQSKHVNERTKKEDSCEHIKHSGEPYKTFYDWLPKTKGNNNQLVIKSDTEKHNNLSSEIEIKCRELLKKARFKDDDAIKEIDKKTFLEAYQTRIRYWGNKPEKEELAIREAFDAAKKTNEKSGI